MTTVKSKSERCLYTYLNCVGAFAILDQDKIFIAIHALCGLGIYVPRACQA